MAYRQNSDPHRSGSGVDIPVCHWPKAKIVTLLLLCMTLLQPGCREESQAPRAGQGQSQQVETPVEPVVDHGTEASIQPVPPPANQEPHTTLSDTTLDRFTDRMVFPALAKSDDSAQRREAEQAFDMVYVVGDPEKSIEPFYLSQTEVRLEMYYPWAMGYGMGWSDGEVRRCLGFYPSQYAMFYNSHQRLYNKRFPALAMSRTVAELYCETLSELTGRAYRLPTEAEWEHALKLGGGVPADRASLLRIAHLQGEENWSDDSSIWPVPVRVGTKSPDRLRLHDMLGNAAEWAADTGEERVVRGGHFELPVEELKADWRAVEDIEVWNETYPNLPRPEGFYRDFPYTGIRLACDADQAPKSSPDVPQTPESPAP